MRCGFRAMLTEILALDFRDIPAEHILLRQSGLFELHLSGFQRAHGECSATEPVGVAVKRMRERHEQQHDDTDGDHSGSRHGRDNAAAGLQQ